MLLPYNMRQTSLLLVFSKTILVLKNEWPDGVTIIFVKYQKDFRYDAIALCLNHTPLSYPLSCHSQTNTKTVCSPQSSVLNLQFADCRLLTKVLMC
ncbi:hypothetical protein KsCSTR_29270 [Candidatus Kuenenia stuttgartiensis]|uniref:Uncharacterized protein n=1 Tax=Kuenenia stuttgartiensis TaxID=174633 RepID=Q1Q5S8_KUEST|nr:hypothetical protein KsCSTR_29270 [Candidatus Kuenenia stuttgartiensis]CAJ75371.1 unknown protein [Candidatus Kuenenia stuttgartiensis]